MRVSGFKLARIQAGLRQIDVAGTLGVSESLVAKWETGRSCPKPEMQKAISKLFDTKKESIFPENKKSVGQ